MTGAADNGVAPDAAENLGEDVQASPTQKNGPAGRSAEEDHVDMGTFDDGSGRDYLLESEDEVSLGPKTLWCP